MGLFDKAKQKAKQIAVDKARQFVQKEEYTGPFANAPLTDVQMWQMPPCKGIAKFHHDRQSKMYLYYPELMPGVVPGQKIVLEAFPGDCTLHSSHSGNMINTRESDVLAWCYMGNMVGMSSWGKEEAVRLIMQGYRVIADAESDDWFAPGMLDLRVWVGSGIGCYDVVGQ